MYFVVALAAVAAVYLVVQLRRRLNPIGRALRRASNGEIDRALGELRARVERNPSSAALHGALGRVYLLGKRPSEAESELRKALELGSSSAFDHAALAWALVRMGRFDEAQPWAEAAHKTTHEDFGVYCLYCGLMARHGQAAEMVQLFDFLKRSAIQIQRRAPKIYQIEQHDQFEFARSEMQSAGYV